MYFLCGWKPINKFLDEFLASRILVNLYYASWRPAVLTEPLLHKRKDYFFGSLGSLAFAKWGGRQLFVLPRTFVDPLSGPPTGDTSSVCVFLIQKLPVSVTPGRDAVASVTKKINMDNILSCSTNAFFRLGLFSWIIVDRYVDLSD